MERRENKRFAKGSERTRSAKTGGFRWLASYYEAIRDLPDAERLMMYDAITDFGFGNDVGELPPLLAGYFRLIAPTLERSIRFEEKQKANGERGGRPKKPRENPNETQSDSGENLAVAIDVAVDNAVESAIAVESAVEKAGKPPRASRFTPPSVEEVQAYCRERGNAVDAGRFLDFYTAKGWRIGKEAMMDWRAAVRTWEHADVGKNIRSPERYAYAEGESL